MRPSIALPPSRALAAFAVLTLAACSGGSSGGGGLDPGKPDDLLYSQGLAAYNDANQLVADARVLDPTLASGAAAAKIAQAEARYATARGFFDQLTSAYPASIRYDDAAYLAGRCSYEIGTLSSAAASYQDAATRLAAFAAARPGSPVGDKVAYFEGRARFHLAGLPSPLDTYAAAREDLLRSLALNASGTYADNAQYYLGRTWFEEGFPLANGLVANPDPVTATTAKIDLQNAEAELVLVPSASTYWDNARYYLGVSYSMEPESNSTIRAQKLDSAVAAFGQCLAAAPAGSFAPGAHYWRGKAHYDLAFQRASGGVKDQAEISLAIADFHVVPPPSVHADNALYWLAKSYVWVDPGPLCTAGTGAAPADACASVRALNDLVNATGSAYSASPYPQLAVDYVTTVHPPNATGCICP